LSAPAPEWVPPANGSCSGAGADNEAARDFCPRSGAPPGRAVRLLRTLGAETAKARRQPALFLFLLITIVVAAVFGPLQHRSAKAAERELAGPARSTHAFGAPAPPPPAPEAAGRGANGFLTLAASCRAGAIVSALLLLLYAAGILAGEGTGGTLRLLLTRPVSRGDLLAAKATLLLCTTLVFTVAVALTGGIAGLLTGGYGDFVDPRYGQVDYTAGELWSVAAKSLALVPLALFATACFGLLVSALFDSTGTAVTVSVLGGFGALAGAMILPAHLAPLDFLAHVDRGLAVLHSCARGLSEYRFDGRFLLPGIVVPAVSALVFLLAARILFAVRNIHS
jgi:ABC-type transport system involved in multi-copper enzyme maturation permease subunit